LSKKQWVSATKAALKSSIIQSIILTRRIQTDSDMQGVANYKPRHKNTPMVMQKLCEQFLNFASSNYY